ncbi:unnamed protein product [Ascophyllum nodosum]
MARALGVSCSATRRHISPNPPAGEVRSREVSYGPWMETTNRRIEAENTKARTILFDRRVFGLAKQAVESLEAIGVRCEMTTIANILRNASKHRALGKEEQQAISGKTREEMEHACRVLNACLKFDGQHLATLLGLAVRREKTFGEGVPL